MAKVRSPNYPSMSLSPALDAIRVAYEKDHRNKMSRLVLAKHMGYGGLNGRALGRIGAVRAYGLVEGSGDELRISDDAVTALMAPVGSQERTAALARLANRPTLIQEIRKDFPDTFPSLENLKFSLIKRQFTPDAAEKAAKAYLASFNLVAGIPDAYNPPDDEDEGEAMETQQQHSTGARQSGLDRQANSIAKPIQEVFHLPEGTVTITFPNRLSMESYQDLEDQLSLILRRVKRQSGKDEEAAN